MRRIIWALSATALMLGACGGDGAATNTTAEAATTTMQAATTTTEAATTTTEAATTTTEAATTTAAEDAGGSLSEEEQAAADALVASITDLGNIEMLSFLAGNRADPNCWAEYLVESLGIEATAAIAVATIESEFVDAFAALPNESQNAAADGLAACLDRDGLREDIIEFDSPEVADCAIGFALEPDRYRTMFIAFVTDDEDAMAEFETALDESCGFG